MMMKKSYIIDLNLAIQAKSMPVLSENIANKVTVNSFGTLFLPFLSKTAKFCRDRTGDIVFKSNTTIGNITDTNSRLFNLNIPNHNVLENYTSFIKYTRSVNALNFGLRVMRKYDDKNSEKLTNIYDTS